MNKRQLVAATARLALPLGGGVMVADGVRTPTPAVAEPQIDEIAKLPGSDPWLKPGEILVVHVAPRRRRTCVVVAFERVRPH